MLKSLDILIGLAVVMLVLSLVVTVLTQFVTDTLFNLRGRALKLGLAKLLTLIDNGITRDDADKIVDYVLRHYLVSRKGRLAHTIHREEFAKLVIDYAAQGTGARQDNAIKLAKLSSDQEDTRERLLKSLKANGVLDPVAALKRARNLALELERQAPELANDVRQTMALIDEVGGDYLAKLNAWFDQTVDRVTDRFTLQSRRVTLLFGAIVAVALQVNTFEIINRLSSDDSVRTALLAEAVRADMRGLDLKPQQPADPSALSGAAPRQTAEPAPSGTTEPNAGAPRQTAQPALPGHLEQLAERMGKDTGLRNLVDTQVIAPPKDEAAWLAYWKGEPDSDRRITGQIGRILGIMVTIALLSLGAPLWYELLGNLLNLRTLVSQRDDQQRRWRQSNQPPALPVRQVGTAAAETKPAA